MATNKLNLNAIVSIIVNLSAKSAARKAFNLGCIIGRGSVIPQEERVRVYTSADGLLADGFEDDSEEYKAAVLYFSASSAPRRLAVGRILETETVVEGVRACRNANSEWYACTVCGCEEEDIKEVAAYIESAEPSSLFMYTTRSQYVLQPSFRTDEESGEQVPITDIFTFLKDKNYRRTFGQYCGQTDTQDAVAATMGYAMGANTGTADSTYTLAYKTLVGITPDDLTNAQVEYVVGTRDTAGNNGNVYITRAEEYYILQQGYMADKTSFDEILNLDMLKNELQLSAMDLLYQRKKVPQTEAGMAAFTNALSVACSKFVKTGFIAPGKWNGANCLELLTGDYLPDGYLIQHEAIDSQSQADRDARKAPPFYVCCKLAGAIEFVTIEVNVNR